MDTGQHLDQRGLAGTVLADEGVGFAGVQVDRTVHQGLYSPKGLHHMLEHQHRLWGTVTRDG